MQSRSTLLALALAALVLVPAPAVADPVATDQYILRLPGSPEAEETEAAAAPTTPARNATGGVTGEASPGRSRLAAVTTTVLSPWVLLTLAGVTALAVVAARHRRTDR